MGIRAPSPGGSYYVTYDYDLADAVTAIRENGTAALTTYTYDLLGRRGTATRGNSTTEAYTYDAASRFAQITNDLAATAHDRTVGFTYNASGQIVARENFGTAYQWTPIAPETVSYADNALNQYTSVGGASQSHSQRGNRTTGSIGYDIYNRLTSAPGVTLSYDPADRLYETNASGTVTRFVYDGDALIAEYDGTNNLLRRYVHGPGVDEPIVWYEGADRRWLVSDERGSIVAVANNSGVATSIYSYDGYGRPNAWSGARFRFTGQMMLPEAQLYHYRARAYDPVQGRFLQPDPIGVAGGMNLYGYVGNDPVNFTDPTGLLDELEMEELYSNAMRPRGMGGFGLGGFMASLNGSLGGGRRSSDFAGPGATAQGPVVAQEPPCDAQCQRDAIVVTAQRKKRLGGIRINFGLRRPREQLWAVTADGNVVHIPTRADEIRDSCGNRLGRNVPDGSVPSNIAAIVHTHPRWAHPGPAAGDYTSAQRYDVYGIHSRGTWVLRAGAARGSLPTTLSGRAPGRRPEVASCR